ncbi:MAG: CHAP domain-containing protein [Bacteroidota bacterium]
MTRVAIPLLLLLCLCLGMGTCKKKTTEGKGALTIPMEEIEPALKAKELPRPNVDPKTVKTGDVIDFYNGVPVYFNGNTFHTAGRHLSEDGYNYGLRWQCVEFVKRYYYDYLNHEMPDTYGHAKDFFLPQLRDGQYNWLRDLQQFRNGGTLPPQVDDIIVFTGDEYGHVAIISKVEAEQIEIVQQNVGIASRHQLKLMNSKGRYYVMSKAVIGWLGRRD